MAMDFMDTLDALTPRCDADAIEWEGIAELLGPVGFSSLAEVPQHLEFHGEGDVFAHTRLVCQELVGLEGYVILQRKDQLALFLSALLHDIGKKRTTRLEDGQWSSPRHASVGSRMVREFLWRGCGMAGNAELQAFREEVCALVAFHMFPGRLVERDDAMRKVREVAALGELVSGMTWRLVCLLAEADARGRVARDVDEMVERVELARLLAEEAGCLDGPYPFAGSHVRRAYMAGRNVVPDQPLFDGSWGEVLVMAGLPGTGKDTWIANHAAEMAIVSLDELRRRMGVGSEEPQGRVVQAALEQARVHLRRHEPFVWNATCLKRDTRSRVVSLAERYGARARIVYLETSWDEALRRNASRKEAERVPERIVERMLSRMDLPAPSEAHVVEWLCV